MACDIFQCGTPDLVAAQTLISINGVPTGGTSPFSFDFGSIECCNGGFYDLTMIFQNNFSVNGQGQPIAIDGNTYHQLCWPFVNGVPIDEPPCLGDNCNGQIQVLAYTVGSIPFQGLWSITVRITPDCINCCVSDLQSSPNQLLIYPSSNLINDVCCQIIVNLGYNIDNRIYTLTSGPITPTSDICECTNTIVTVRNDSCETKDMNFSLLNCNSYLSLIGQTQFLGVAPQQVVQLTIRYCPDEIEIANCDLALNDGCPTDILFPITASSSCAPVYTVISGPIDAIASTCECVDRIIQIRNDSTCNKDMDFSLLNCNGYLSLIGQTQFLTVTPQQVVQITLRYCPQTIEIGNCDLVLSDGCSDDTLFPINVASVECPPEQAICLNCDFLSINGTKLESCESQCVNIGDTITLYGNVGFPVRSFGIIAADNVLNTFTIAGDYTAGFVPGTIFDVVGSTCNNGTYTVVSAVFNGTNTIITVIGAVPCVTPDGTIENIQYCQLAPDPCDPCIPTPCFQTVHVLIENQDTGQVIYDQTLPAVNNNFLVNLLHTITTFGTYHILIEACDCFGCRKCEWFLEACFQYEIKRIGCHQYNVIDNQLTPTKINTVTVTNQDGSYTATYTFDTSITNFVPIVTPEDGIYTVTISNNLTSDVQTFVIFDFCDLIACYRKLILDLFCNEADPCCKECNDEQKRKMEEQRAELNKMVALAGTLFAFVYRDQITHLGVFTMDECRELDLQMISDIFDKLNEITFRCGECKKTTPITPSPCPTCP